MSDPVIIPNEVTTLDEMRQIRDQVLQSEDKTREFKESAESADEQSQKWAESDEAPAGPGTKSAKTHSQEAGQHVVQAQRWATLTDGPVEGEELSSKAYSIEAKDAAIQTNQDKTEISQVLLPAAQQAAETAGNKATEASQSAQQVSQDKDAIEDVLVPQVVQAAEVTVQKAGEAIQARDKSQDWAEKETEPGAAGTRSAKKWSEQSRDWAESETAPEGFGTRSAKKWSEQARDWAEKDTSPDGTTSKSAKTHAQAAADSETVAITQAGIATQKALEASEVVAAGELPFIELMEKHYPAVPHERRVLNDSGTLRGNFNALNRILNFLQSSGLQNLTEVLICPEATGVKQGVSALRVSKAYSIQSKTKDGSLATALNQLHLSGTVAPNEKLGLRAYNDTVKRVVFPQVFLGAKENASVTIVFKSNGLRGPSNYRVLCSNGDNNPSIAIINDIVQYVRTSSVGAPLGPALNRESFIEKTCVITITKEDQLVKCYFNGVFHGESSTVNSSFAFSSIYSNIQINSLPSQMEGDIFYFRIQKGAMSLTQAQQEYNTLRSLFPEVESVSIGSQQWASSNLELILTPSAGSTIINVPLSASAERVVNGGFDDASGWTIDPSWSIAGGVATCGPIIGSTQRISRSENFIVTGRLYKIKFTVVSGTADMTFANNAGSLGFTPSIRGFYGPGTYTRYVVGNIVGGLGIFAYPASTVFALDDVSVKEVGWEDADEVYQETYAVTSGTHEQKHVAGLRMASMWCYYNNSVDTGALYGKLYNGYAIQLIQAELGSGYGWKIPSVVEVESLMTQATLDGLKHLGTEFWDAPNTGTNSSGFTLLPSGQRQVDGSFSGLRTAYTLATIDGTEELRLGRSIRLIKI